MPMYLKAESLTKTHDKNVQSDDTLASVSTNGSFVSAHALPKYRCKALMRTGITIDFNFKSRLDTMRFGALREVQMFRSVRTDGNYMIFEKKGKIPIIITASEFMDLVLNDCRGK